MNFPNLDRPCVTVQRASPVFRAAVVKAKVMPGSIAVGAVGVRLAVRDMGRRVEPDRALDAKAALIRLQVAGPGGPIAMPVAVTSVQGA